MSVDSLSAVEKLSGLVDSFGDGQLIVSSKTKRELSIEKGNDFLVTDNYTLGEDESVFYSIDTNNDIPILAVFNLEVEGKVDVNLYEDGSVSGGSSVDAFANINRATGSDDADTEVLGDVSVDSQGSLIGVGGVGGESNPQNKIPVPGTVVGAPWVFKSGTVYILEVVNDSNSDIDVNFKLGFELEEELV